MLVKNGAFFSFFNVAPGWILSFFLIEKQLLHIVNRHYFICTLHDTVRIVSGRIMEKTPSESRQMKTADRLLSASASHLLFIHSCIRTEIKFNTSDTFESFRISRSSIFVQPILLQRRAVAHDFA